MREATSDGIGQGLRTVDAERGNPLGLGEAAPVEVGIVELREGATRRPRPHLRPVAFDLQRVWSVYIALPSACRHRTGRSGAANAAPAAAGSPIPIAPPVRQMWS